MFLSRRRLLYMGGGSAHRCRHTPTHARDTTALLLRMQNTSRHLGARPRYAMAPAASQSPAPAAPGIATPEAWPAASADADRAFTWLSANAVLVLAILVCGLFATIALHVVLQSLLRVTGRAWFGAGSGLHEPAPRASGGRGGRNRGAQALPCLAYSAGLELAGSSRSECAICLAEFERGEQVRVLPRCNHGFHALCIDRWLAARPTCPTCRQAPFAEPDESVLAADCARPAPAIAVVRVIVDGGGRRRLEI
ncbi:hypothetical protein VPH35_003342 [Triticum aestivum]|uniref:RING-type domain-containing protein n=3 Tax=Triticum TaxID=4564 RepID=A0A9R0QA52_TRITD|nr:unnamed protein product [Triticum turgidum subsp. durum]